VCIDLQEAHNPFLPKILGLDAALFGEREKSGDEKSLTVFRDGQPARLKVAIAVRVIAHTLPQINVADGAPVPRINDRNGILAAVA
jgi:hypothetical protein